ncbi:hypothetical protein PENSPDRAFT_36554 [Peniophora sp. CONT]|nr:hypothetical protein PENSPDRAFT_36554 [Peniophora sp. CONT]
MAHVAALSSRILLHTATDDAARPRVHTYFGPPSSLRRRSLPSIPELPVPDAYQPLCLRRARRERKCFQERSNEWWDTWVIAHKHNTCAFDELASFSDMVKVLIDYFRRDAVREALQDVYLYFNNADTIAGTSGSSEWGSHIPTLPDVDASLSSQLKDVAAQNEDFPFDGEADFGPWRILVTHEARKALREADGKIYEVYRRKMRELSHGHLYGDNQKKLAGGKKNQLIPLYEAKMTRDSRLVYQIHVVPDNDQLHERQVIRVWAIYNHRQLDKSRMWSVVDHQEQMNERLWGPRYGRMARRREYQQRCAARTSAQGTSQMVIPTVWPVGVGGEEDRSKARTRSGSKGRRLSV